MSNFATAFRSAPLLRPQLNLGCLMDIPTGTYIKGKHGEHILNGGLSYITGIVGRGNMFKSVFAHFQLLTVLNRYFKSSGNVLDTEFSLIINRMYELALAMDYIAGVDLEAEQRLTVTDLSVYAGNEWFSDFKRHIEGRRDKPADNLGTTPFLDKDGKLLKAFYPAVAEIDSFSQFMTDSVEKIQEEEIGSSGRNVEALRGAMAKNQMMMELPGVTARGGGYVILTAHVGDELNLDPYAPPAKKLAFMKKAKIKNVPEKFTFLTNNCWYCFGSEVLINQTTKAPEFPRNGEDNMKGDTDLMKLSIQNLRAKSGPTGMPFEVIVSQSDGVHVGLTEFNYIRSFERYGIGGNLQNYYLELVPNINLSRTTVRGKIDDSPKLQRALEITSELCQIKNLWHDVPAGLLCDPKTLYEDLKAKGYDWDILLEETRGFWTFEEENHPKKFLSTYDLLYMKAGEYRPWWYDDLVKAKSQSKVTNIASKATKTLPGMPGEVTFEPVAA